MPTRPSPRSERLGTPKTPAIRFTRDPFFEASLVRQLLRPVRLLAPLDGSDQVSLATGGFYIQASGGSVALPVAGYDYNSNWTPLLAGLSPAGMAASLAAPDPSRADRHLQERNTSMMRTSVVALALSAGVILSGSAFAESPKFDVTWSVSLVANGGLCGSATSSTLMVQNGSVRAGGAGVSVSGQVGPSGSVSLALQKSGVQGSASGKLSGSSGSGSWSGRRWGARVTGPHVARDRPG